MCKKVFFTFLTIGLFNYVLNAQNTWGIINQGATWPHFFNDMEGYVFSGSDMYFTTDAGVSKTQVPGINMSQHYLTSAYFSDLNNGYSIWDKFSDHTFKFFTTSNGGSTWTQVGSVNYSNDYNSIGFFDNLFFLNSNFAYTFGKAFRLSDSKIVRKILVSTDGGQNWTIKDIPSELDELWDVVFLDANTAYCTNNKKVYKSTNGGDNWTEMHDFGHSIRDLEFVDNNTAYATGLMGSYNPKVYKTTDGGSNWTELTVNLSPPANHTNLGTVNLFLEASFLDANHGILAAQTNKSKGAVLRTTDGGTTWTRDSLGADVLATVGTWSIHHVHYVSQNVQYASTGNDLLRTGNPSTTGIYEDRSQTQLTVFPNPGNGKISFDLANQPLLNVRVSDMDGRQVFVEKQHEGQLDISNLTTGVYIIQFSDLQGTDYRAKYFLSEDKW